MKTTTGKTVSAAGLIIPLFLASCTLWNARKWQELPDRGFAFAQFKYTNLNAGKPRALAAMREFPLEPVLESLRKKYAITIDAAEFEAFLSRGDLAKIREEGMLMTNSYAWDSASKGANRAEIEIKVNYGDDMRVMNYSYQVVLKVDGSVRAIYFDNVREADKLPAKILAHIGAGVTMAGYAPAKFTDAHTANGKGVMIQGRRWETEGRIKDQVDGYMKMLTPDNKKKFRDDMMRHLDEAAK